MSAPLTLTQAATAWDQIEKQPTPRCELGPFYKRQAPNRTVLRAPGDPGLPLSIAGKVFDVHGNVLPQAKVEVWQTDHLGRYDTSGYRYRATVQPDSTGEYRFDSVMPGHYPSRVCQHIHYLVSAPDHKPLITQLYFATDPVFDGDPDANFHRDPIITNRELVRPVRLAGDPGEMHAAVTFELVLERL